MPDAQQLAEVAFNMRARPAGVVQSPHGVAAGARTTALLGGLLPGVAPDALPLLAAALCE